MSDLQTPVLLIIFNRPDLVQQVFAVLRHMRPSHLFIAADGPRLTHPEDAALCAQCRAIVDQVDWPCQVERNYAETNLTCGRRVATAIDWLFTQVEEAIILEDDILPDPSFFAFCQTLLDRYRDDESTMGIGGYNHLGEWRKDEGSYFFHRHPITWGWATWKRAWACFDFNLTRYRSWNVHEKLVASTADPEMAEYQWQVFQYLDTDTTTAWDIQWSLICTLLGRRWISPAVNLVTNVGFNSRATHTTLDDDLRRYLRRGRISLPFIDPPPKQEIDIDTQFDRWVFLLQTVNSYRNLRALRVWQRAIDANPDLAMPGILGGGRPILAPLRQPAELLALLDYVTPLMTDNPRLHSLRAEVAAMAVQP
jgi:hypothetical protein